jgi:hypothetical protein
LKDNGLKNKAPTNPKIAIENSKFFKEKGMHQRRLGYDQHNDEIVVLDGNINDTFHGP